MKKIFVLVTVILLAGRMPAQENQVYGKMGIAPVNGGFSMEGYWVWCGSVIRGDDGQYHMFASRWPKKLPFHPGWMVASEIVHAVSKTPEGPYTFSDVVLPARGPQYWDGRSTHNPRIVKYKDTYILYYMGSTHPFDDVMKNPDTLTLQSPYATVGRSNKRIGIATSKNLYGPWQRRDTPILDTKPGTFYSFLTSNPAPLIKEDGSVLMVFKARGYKNAYPYQGDMVLGVATAPNSDGPYTVVSNEPIFSKEKFGEVEDPFIWKDETGYHMLAKDQRGSITGKTHSGMIAFSKDGLHWQPEKAPLAYTKEIHWSDGHTQEMGQLERASPLIQNGVITHIFFATMDGSGGFQNGTRSWNMVVPMKAQQAEKTRDQQAIDSAINGWRTASMKTHDARITWWREAKFGMFIHWGIYSLPAGQWNGHKVSGYAEHLMRKEKITRNDYLDLAHRFNPVLFNADEWARQAKQAGMKYLIITAKHHDGFAMYPSKISNFNIHEQTPFKRDPMAELAAACKKQGIRFGFYYSHAFDWEDPNAPGNDWEYDNPGGDKLLHGGANWFDAHPELLPKAQRYVDEKAIPQIKELLLTYHPDILWFDTPHKLPLTENMRILKAIRDTDPNVVVNGRLVRTAASNFGDYKNTADRPAEFYPVTGDWEAIPTTNESYGYHQYDNSHKSPGFFVRLLAKAVSRGGNLLMNIGPKGDGTIDVKDQSILKGIGNWMSDNSASIFNAHPSGLALQNWGVTTAGNNLVYLHIFEWPADGWLQVGGLSGDITKARLLAGPSNSPLTVQAKGKDLYIKLPKQAPDTVNTVIVLETKGKLTIDPLQFVASNIPVTRLLAFDATLHGKGLKYGDGKADKYYVDGWESTDQWLSWDFRTAAPGNYRVVIRYLASGKDKSAYMFQLDDLEIERKAARSGREQVVTEELGTVSLKAGRHQLSIKPVTINGELMKLLEVQLIQKNK